MGCSWSWYEQNVIPKISLNDLEKHAKTGDVLLFSGAGFVSNIISLANLSSFSHVGMVLDIEGVGLCVWESSTADGTSSVDYITKTIKDGPRLIPLRQSIENYVQNDNEGYVVCWRQLHLPMNIRKNLLKTAASNEFSKFLVEESKKQFEVHKDDVVRSLYPYIPGGIPTGDPTSRFCSELVAETLYRLGLLSSSPPSDQYTVLNFIEGYDYMLKWKIINGRNVGNFGPTYCIDIY